MRLVLISSPYSGNIFRNLEYARACVRDSLSRGEAPFASHLLYTQPGILRDEIPRERQWGVDAGLAWLKVIDAIAVYIDHGISKGMENEIRIAIKENISIESRSLTGAIT